MTVRTFQDRPLTVNQIAAVDGILAGLPTLTGTDKQVAWATDIRAKVVLNTVMLPMRSAVEDNAKRQQVIAGFSDASRSAKVHVCDASRWIESPLNAATLPTLIDILRGQIAL